MLEMGKIDIKSMKIDVVKNATAIIVLRLLQYYMRENNGSDNSENSIFTEKYIYDLVFLLMGFVVYNIVFAPIINAE